MNRFGVKLGRHALAAQLALVGLALVCAAFWPPSQGRMLLVPMLPGTANPMLVRAIDGGAQLLGGGPLPGSMVVTGAHAALAVALRGKAVLILAAPPALCGGPAA
ncbi:MULTISPECIES: hypothetical protein [unclassified Sphingomonas]|uniref:hypothetical protein n=1 Tax=unclassified Sphingomonas TaxID=196159 RepID=UPI0022B2CB68|nr:hypothetical protein [Sphingomonas sp. NIBR02145]WHU00879.1 hypothetical protein O3305_11655 [Sphingomonas sp. NIBR02145]